jgi:hypothetical protein
VDSWAAFDAARGDPWLRRCLPGDLGDRGQRLWRREALPDLLDRLPQTLVHGDADRRTRFARRGPAGDETVAIDWAFTGVAAVGEELVNLVAASVLWFQAEPQALPELADRCLEGYVAGLADAGWRGDPRLAQAGFVVGAAAVCSGERRRRPHPSSCAPEPVGKAVGSPSRWWPPWPRPDCSG